MRFVDDLARRFGPQDVVIFEQPRSVHLLSLPLWAVHGVNALELARFNPDPARLQHLVAGLARTVSQHLLRPHLQHGPVRPLPPARRGPELRHLRVGAGVRLEAARAGAARAAFPHLARGAARGPPGPAAAGDRRRRLRRPPGLRLLRQGGRRRPHLPLDGTLRAPSTCPARGRATRSRSPPPPGAGPSGVPVPVSVTVGRRGRWGGSRRGATGRSTRCGCPTRCPRARPCSGSTSPTFRPVNVVAGDTDDARDLGVMLDRIRLREGAGGRNATIPVSRAAGGSP